MVFRALLEQNFGVKTRVTRNALKGSASYRERLTSTDFPLRDLRSYTRVLDASLQIRIKSDNLCKARSPATS